MIWLDPKYFFTYTKLKTENIWAGGQNCPPPPQIISCFIMRAYNMEPRPTPKIRKLVLTDPMPLQIFLGEGDTTLPPMNTQLSLILARILSMMSCQRVEDWVLL